ncbi:McrC family protein [Aeromonas allosaccharophila]|uniref:McrC family protein n=1 Tax=Aeromonas allosaccharophila TaxID=656 RepID=UPI0013C8576E|nr:McrC family protein [Aeromonas allosaccharophila]WDO02207.1 McrC family protein [Aeromonas allosaccharophila]
MKGHVIVREYARLTCEPLDTPSLDRAHISRSAFMWLCELAGQFSKQGAPMLHLDGRQWLRLDSYVGVLESPCGQIIEILPKTHDAAPDENMASEVSRSRRMLKKMLASAMALPLREAEEAGLELGEGSLSEWVMGRFLSELEHLVRHGLRFDYAQVEEEAPFLRGQLDLVRQLRQPAGRQHKFRIRHDLFQPESAEHRLIRCALDLVCKATRVAHNWRLSHELQGMLHELQPSREIERDLRAWRTDRLMARYQAIKPWCELILQRQMPMALHGQWRGLSLLYPMERLFEAYVARQLRRQLPSGLGLKTQSRAEYLCHYGQAGLAEGAMFQLKPDLLLEGHASLRVMDTKWKRLEQENRQDKFGLSQQDFYQMLAYGQTYQGGAGDMCLIYPKWRGLDRVIGPFLLANAARQPLRLWAVPFDLESGQMHLPDEISWSSRQPMAS